MKDELLYEVRYQEDETRLTPGRLVGTLMTYGERAKDRAEMFADSALTFPPNGIVIDEQHNRQAPILRVMPTVENGVVTVNAPFPDTQRGRDAATNVRLGILTGLSVTFHSEVEEMRNGVRVIKRAYVPRAGLVDDPSYKGSRAEVRSKDNMAEVVMAARLWL